MSNGQKLMFPVRVIRTITVSGDEVEKFLDLKGLIKEGERLVCCFNKRDNDGNLIFRFNLEGEVER